MPKANVNLDFEVTTAGQYSDWQYFDRCHYWHLVNCVGNIDLDVDNYGVQRLRVCGNQGHEVRGFKRLRVRSDQVETVSVSVGDDRETDSRKQVQQLPSPSTGSKLYDFGDAGFLDNGASQNLFTSNVMKIAGIQSVTVVGNLTVPAPDKMLFKIVPIMDSLGTPYTGGPSIAMVNSVQGLFHVTANLQQNKIAWDVAGQFNSWDNSAAVSTALPFPLPGGLPFVIQMQRNNAGNMTLNAIKVGVSVQ